MGVCACKGGIDVEGALLSSASPILADIVCCTYARTDRIRENRGADHAGGCYAQRHDRPAAEFSTINTTNNIALMMESRALSWSSTSTTVVL